MKIISIILNVAEIVILIAAIIVFFRKKRLNIPLHSTFYCFIKLLVNHAFTSFKPFHLFRISQAYIYNSALSCIIRVRKNSRLRSP